MPYKDPEKQKAAERESKRRRRAAAGRANVVRVAAEADVGVEHVLPDPPDRDELVRLLGVQARSGSVRAIELLLRLDPETDANQDAGDKAPKSALAQIHELAQRRSA